MNALTFLTARWMRSSGSRRSATMLVLSFTVLAAIFVTMSALTLSPAQESDKSFGNYQRQTYSNVQLGALTPGALAVAGAELGSALPGTHISLESTAVKPDSFAKTYVQAPLQVLRFVQDPELQNAFPGRYALESGHWPRAPMDVVVTKHLRDALPDPTQFTVLSNRVTFHVVGIVTDAYATRADTIVAGPGTWEAIPRPSPGHIAAPIEAQVSVFFSSSTSIGEVGQALTKILPPVAKNDGVSLLKENYSARLHSTAQPEAAFGSDQLVVSYLPLLLVVLLVSVFVIGQNRTLNKVIADRLVAIGVRRSHVKVAQVAALTIVSAGSIVAGLVLGWLGGVAIRVTVLPRVADQRLSPLPGLDRTSVAIAASALVFITMGALWPERPKIDGSLSTGSDWLNEVKIAVIRRVSAVLAVIAAVQVGANSRSVVPSYLAIVAVLLLAPDVLRAVLCSLPSSSPRNFVARRLMRTDLGRQAAAVVVVACCIALPTLVGTQLASKKASDATFTFSRIPSDQIWVQSDAAIGDVQGVAEVVSRVSGIGRPVVIRGAHTPGPDASGSSRAFFAKQQRSGRSSNAIMIVDSADQVRRLVGGPLPRNAETVLDSGGVLNFTHTDGNQRFVVFSGSKRLFTTPELPTLRVSLDRQFSANFGGAVLLSTAERLKLPVSEPTRYIYPNASSRMTEDAVQAAVNAGYDSGFVQYAVAPPEPDLPTYAYVFLAALILGGYALLLNVIKGQAARLRAYNSRLVAIGLTPRWTLSVLGIQTAIVLGVGLLVGIIAGILGVKITDGIYAATKIPIVQISLATGAIIIAAGIATFLAVRTLTAAERSEMT